ncbi:phosphotransferase family protein [Haloarchaeobius sp. DFWS5]|uniref:phosphotransferase family protein n=1 Tax=Haloarchaeobius sp. DFWS5 TaxID=3446114 RepID=UPI003EBDA6BE
MTDDSAAYFARLVDEDALRAYLREELGDADTFEVERHREGHSNETLFCTWGERDLVIRRPPPGETADSAHDVLREYRVMDALQDTAVPLPNTVLACDDHAVLGSDFFAMDRLDGEVLRGEEPDAYATHAARQRVGEELVDTLAAIHEVDYEAVGLGEFGYPDGFTERQVKRWSEQLMWAFSKTSDEREVPVLYDVLEWLQDNVPEDYEHTLVHGDYKLDNVLYSMGDDGPDLAGVFDWELSTLGDPLTDLGWMLAFWRDPGDPDPAAPGLLDRFPEREGYPSRPELVARYEAATGIDYEHDRFYRALAVYKLAALGEMFFARHLAGDADDPLYPQMREAVPRLGEWAKRIVDGDEPL